MGPIEVTTDGAVLHIRLSRPQVRNAINQAMADAVSDAVDQLEADPALRVAVIDGADGTFCSGMDLKAYLAGERPVAGDRGLLGIANRMPRKPLIAAVEGYALGAGFEVILSCDLAVAAESAVFALPEVQRGLLAGGGGTIHLAQRLPRALASDLILTGRRLSAAEAVAMGLASRIAPDGAALDAAMELARAMAQAPAVTVATARELMAEARWWQPHEAFDLQAPYLQRIIESPEARQGAQAFVTKGRNSE